MTAPMPACVRSYRAIVTGARYGRHSTVPGIILVELPNEDRPRAINDLTRGGDLSTLPALCAAAADEHEAEHERIWGKPQAKRQQIEMEV